MTNPPTIKAMVQAVPRSLGSYGPVLLEIEAALQSPQCNLSTIGDAIQKDPDLTARLLRLANSPFFGFANRLSTVAEAVSLLGIQQIQDMIVASSVLEQFKGVPDNLVNKDSFWRHSLAVGITARLLAMERRLPKPDKFFVAGLLHDVGRLVLLVAGGGMRRRQFLNCISARKSFCATRRKKFSATTTSRLPPSCCKAGAIRRCWCRPWLFTTRRTRVFPSSTPPSSTSPIIWSTPWASAVPASSSSRRSTTRPGLCSASDTEMLGKIVEAVDEQILAVEEAFLKK